MPHDSSLGVYLLSMGMFIGIAIGLAIGLCIGVAI